MENLSPGGTAENVFRPCRDFELCLDELPSHKWLGYVQSGMNFMKPGIHSQFVGYDPPGRNSSRLNNC